MSDLRSRVKWIIQSDCGKDAIVRSEEVKSNYSTAQWFMILKRNGSTTCGFTLDCVSGAYIYSGKATILNPNGANLTKNISGALKHVEFDLSWEQLFNNENGYIQDDILSIEVELTWNTLKENEAQTVFSLSREKKLSSVLMKDFQERKFTDCCLYVEGQMIPAHRVVLAGYSDVFKDIFTSNDPDSSKVTIGDYSFSVVFKSLMYLYSDGQDDIPAEQLLSALSFCDRYGFISVLNYCQKEVIKHLNVDNFCDYYSMLDRHNSHRALFDCVQYFQQHAKEIVSSNGFKKLESEFAKQLLEDFFSE